MKELVNNMLAEIEVNISEIDLYGYDIVETFLSIVRRLQAVLNDLKNKNCKFIPSIRFIG